MKPDRDEQQLFAAVMKAERILLLTDAGKDGDTSGSSLAFWHWLKSLGKTVEIWSDKEFPERLKRLPGMQAITIRDQVSGFSGEYDLAIIFDSSRTEYIADIQRQLGSMLFAVVDHHASNPLLRQRCHLERGQGPSREIVARPLEFPRGDKTFGDGLFGIVRPEASSTCEVVYRFFRTHRVRLAPAMATCLLAGMLDDTMHFSNGATNPDVVRAAAELLRAGAEMERLTTQLTKTETPATLALMGRAMSRLIHNPRRNLACTYFTQADLAEFDLEHLPTGEFVAFLQNHLRVPSILVLKETDDGYVRGSVRTEGDLLAFAEFFGGGGHRRACGLSVRGKIVHTGDSWRIEAV